MTSRERKYLNRYKIKKVKYDTWHFELTTIPFPKHHIDIGFSKGESTCIMSTFTRQKNGKLIEKLTRVKL